MRIKSTVEFKSNLQLAKKGIPLLEDREFLANIIDPFAIQRLKKFREKDLTEIQRQIYSKAGSHCMYADDGEYPWGIVRDEKGRPRVICKCLNKKCQYFRECRPEYKELPEDKFEEKSLMNNTVLSYEKKCNCTFQQYVQYSKREKLQLLIDYWELSYGPVISFKFNESGESYLYNEKGQILINPFTKQPLNLVHIDIYKFSHLVFDVAQVVSENEEFLQFVYSGRKEDCQNYAQEILYELKITNDEIKKAVQEKIRPKTTKEIKEKHRIQKDPRLCRHAGCNEIAVRDGYCSEHIRYQKAESK